LRLGIRITAVKDRFQLRRGSPTKRSLEILLRHYESKGNDEEASQCRERLARLNSHPALSSRGKD